MNIPNTRNLPPLFITGNITYPTDSTIQTIDIFLPSSNENFKLTTLNESKKPKEVYSSETNTNSVLTYTKNTTVTSSKSNEVIPII